MRRRMNPALRRGPHVRRTSESSPTYILTLQHIHARLVIHNSRLSSIVMYEMIITRPLCNDCCSRYGDERSWQLR